jgi:hypothetical protein
MDELGLDSVRGHYPEEPLLAGQLVEIARQLRYLEYEVLERLAEGLEAS